MWKALTFLHRTARGGLRVTVREDQPGVTLFCINQDQPEVRTPRVPVFKLTCLEPDYKYEEESKTLISSSQQSLRFPNCQIVQTTGRRFNYKDGYEHWTLSEAFKNIVILVVLYNLVHFKEEKTALPEWLCPYLTFGNLKSIKCQPLHLHGDNIIVKDSKKEIENKDYCYTESLTSLQSSSHVSNNEEVLIDSFSKQTDINLDKTSKQSLHDNVKETKKQESKTVRFAESEFGYELDALEGIDLLERGNPRGLVRLMELSSLGSSVASFHLGMAYESGYMVTQDVKKARRYFEKSARLGNPDAEYNLAVYYIHGRGGLTPNSSKARQLLQSAASKGSEAAVTALHRETSSSENSSRKSSLSSEENSINCKSNVNLDKARGIHLYELGKSFEELGEIAAALEFYTRASEEGYSKAREARQRLQSDCV